MNGRIGETPAQSEWFRIVRIYRNRYEKEYAWWEYLMKFYFPPTRIK